MFFVIIILVICLLVINYYKFEYPHTHFLNELEIYNFILADNDDYFKHLSNADLCARSCKTVEEYKLRILNNLYIPNKINKNYILKKIHKAYNLLSKENYYIDPYKLSKLKFNIVFVYDDILENSFPHTRDNIIFLSTNEFSNKDIIETLIHEMIHIYQRYYPADMQYYLDDNNYIFVRYNNKNDNVRANPDIDNKLYRLNGRLLIAQYNSNQPNDINDCTNNEFEHPNEIMAYDISKKLVKLLFKD